MWQPIETAPKGIDVLVARLDDDGSYWSSVAQWWVSRFVFMYGAGLGSPPVMLYFEPTHWMPLPEPPDPQPAAEEMEG